MTATDTPTNEKAGWSSYCHRDQHRTCTTLGARCACTCHGRTGQTPPAPTPPTPRSQETRMPEPARPLQSVPELRTGPLFRVVKETPAEVRVGRKPLHERVAPFLVEVKADPGAWFRIGTWPSASGGSSAANSLSKAQKDGKLDKKFTFAGRKVDDGSALYACYGEPKADG